MKNIFMGLKVSTDEQVNRGYSLEHQEEKCEIEFGEGQKKVTFSGMLLKSISLALPEIQRKKASKRPKGGYLKTS